MTIYSHSACGGLSHNVNLMVSGSTILPVTYNGSTYTFNGLATNTRHNVIVAYNTSDINVFSESVKTLALRCKFLLSYFKFCTSAKTYFYYIYMAKL